MSDFKNYDPAQFVATFKGILITGYMDGTFINAARNTDTFETSPGSDGDVTRVRKRDRTGQVTITLKAESATNDALSLFMLEDELFGTATGPLMLKNLNGTTVVAADNAWIMKPPDVEGADTASGREWIFACAELRMFVGGALV